MPLARVPTSARSSSRSPLPPSPRPPAFLPPSHYAEAGGISPRTRNDSVASSDFQIPLETRRNSAFMPISSNSDSSFEFGARASPVEQHKRFSIAGSSKSGSAGKAVSPNPSSSRSKRESRMTNLPLVEAQLLPSLRDTIDRMTRPPSRMLSSPPAESDPNEPAPATFSSPVAWSQGCTPNDDAYPVSPPLPSSTPKPLKSALRAPTPKTQLKSPRASTPNGSNLENNPIPAPAPPIPGRQRSRTDPGAPFPTTHASTPKPSSKGSNIPRLRGLPGMRSASSTPRPQQHPELTGEESASDLEMRYELQARDRRSLRVVNGGVTTSESESDGENRASVGLGLGLASPYTPNSFASRLRARFTGSNNLNADQGDVAAERRRKELLGLVKGLDNLNYQFQGEPRESRSSDSECAVVVSGSGRVDFGAKTEPPHVMVSSSSGDLDGNRGHLGREKGRKERPTSLWKRSRSFSPAPPSPLPNPESRAPERAGAKSPSRSPIIRQSSQPNRPTNDISVPHALQRHSVYYNAAPPQPTSAVATPKMRYPNEDQYNVLTHSPDSVYDEPDGQEAWPENVALEQHLNVRQSRNQQRHSDDLANSDTAIISLHSRLAAARDREAFGIPPSASDACARDSDMGQQRMSYLDSGSSLVRVGQSWEEGDRQGGGRDLSFGAEKLFRTLSGRTVDERGRDRSSYAFGQDDILKGRPADFGRPVSVASQSSAGSIYEDEGLEPEPYEMPVQHPYTGQEDSEVAEEAAIGSGDEPAPDAWRATIPPITYSAIADRRGPVEVQRQETIYALYITEEIFVARLTNTINLFVLPLRLQDSRTYISGVPAEIAKLFDWLEDIRNLHSQLLSALRSVRDGQHPVVERVAEAVRESFVKELEVYQPYLARLVNVAGTIARLVADTTSDFGEFVRIQESAGECRGWSLESLLVDPVTRLGRYPAMFRELYDHTPKLHADYIPTFALLHSTELVIKVMTEVKIREDEYDLVKSMSSRIKGLPPMIQLAKRGRRLLFQGQLHRVRTDAQPVPDDKPQSPMIQAPPFNDRRKSIRPDPKRSTKLADAVQTWDQQRSRSGSSGTTTSGSSYSSAASSEPPLTPSSPHFSSRIPFYSPRSKGSNMPQGFHPVEPRPTDAHLVQIFVFTDLVVVAGVSRSNGSEEWTLMDKLGIAKVLGVSEMPEAEDILVLDVLPLDMKNLGDPILSEGVSLELLHLRVSPSDKKELWLDAFRHSLKMTLRLISIPGGCLFVPQSADSDVETCNFSAPQRPMLMPKSPSLIEMKHGGNSSNPRRQEREERAWWSACFRQVLGEFQARDVS